jgi:hypothetical protein
MGIDIYLHWDGQTDEEKKAQYTGFDITAGDVGYLREAYHGEPYATKVMFPETWEDENGEVAIPAAILRVRLLEALEAVEIRYAGDLPEHIELYKKSYVDFVDLVEKLEKEGRNPRIYNSY